MSFTKRAAQGLAPRVTQVAPHVTAGFVHQALDRAIRGVGPLDSAAVAADKQLDEQKGVVDKGIHEVIENNVRLAGGQGFLTNIGGIVTMTFTIPANLAGLALIQCRMVAGILHLRGYDLDDPRVRTAILASLLGEERMLAMIKNKQLPATPMALATAPVHDPQLSVVMANEVASELISRVAGKKLARTVVRKIPLVGGFVGMGTDAYTTWQIGRYVSREFLPRRRR